MNECMEVVNVGSRIIRTFKNGLTGGQQLQVQHEQSQHQRAQRSGTFMHVQQARARHTNWQHCWQQPIPGHIMPSAVTYTCTQLIYSS